MVWGVLDCWVFGLRVMMMLMSCIFWFGRKLLLVFLCRLSSGLGASLWLMLRSFVVVR